MKKKLRCFILAEKRRIKKLILIMKLVIIFSFLASFNILGSVYSQNTRFTYDFSGMTVRDVFRVLEQQSKYRFFYNDDFSYIDQTVDLNVKDENIETILSKLFAESDITFKILENNLVVLTVKAPMQQLTIKGRVTEASTGNPLPGVNIVEKGTNNGTVTNVDGSYSITVTGENAILVFSYMGYLTEEVGIEGKTIIDIGLAEDITALDEVVVIGYGSVKKRELTGAVASVKEGDFNQGVAANAIQLVQGKVAGLSITKMDGGDPTRGYEITLRGTTSIQASQNPLIVIDGISGGDLNTIAPDDIESIDVLKDGSAAAIYGTRGTNGVILVTTKKGKKGAFQVEYSGRFYTEKTLRKIEVLNREEYLEMKARYAASDDVKKNTIADAMEDYGYDTDWYKEITRTPFSQNHHLSLAGGSENNNYRLSFDYLSAEGILLNSSKQEYKLGYNMQQMALKDIVTFNMQLGLSDYKSHPVDYNAFRQVIQHNPTEPVRNPDGSLFEIIGAWQYDNPVGILTERTRDDGGSRLFGNLGADVNIFRTLKASIIGGLQINRQLNGYYQPSYSYPEESSARRGYANRYAQATFTKNLESTLEWKKQINDHFGSIIGGYSYQEYSEEGFFAANADFITDNTLYNNLGLGTWLRDNKGEMSSFKRKSVLAGFFARGAYNYKGKYFLSASIRREGSTKFGKNYRWGTFPAFSVAWDISQEPFFKGVGIIDFLKLRAGYGVTGNEGLSPDNFYIPLVRYDYQGVFFYNGTFINGFGPVSNANPDLRWEKKIEYNFGIDFQLFASRMGGSVDYYIRDTKDLIELYDVPVPPNLYPSTWANVGTMRTSGIEFTLNTTPVKKINFMWESSMMFDYRKNKIITLSNDYYKLETQIIGEIGPPGITANTHQYGPGLPIGNIYGLVFERLDSAGKWVFRDYNPKADTAGGKPSDGRISNDDRDVIGNGVPKYYLGFTNTFRYKNIDLTVMIRGLFDYQIINVKRIWHDNPNFLPRNVMKTAMDTKLDDVPQFSSYYVENGDFIKIDNITLGYTYNFKNQRYFRSARIYGTCTNAFLITKYTGVDPEISFKGLEPGKDDRYEYPSTRTFIIGIYVKF
jgi:TonB-linked SusC/RagA family outer membrane protein